MDFNAGSSPHEFDGNLNFAETKTTTKKSEKQLRIRLSYDRFLKYRKLSKLAQMQPMLIYIN